MLQSDSNFGGKLPRFKKTGTTIAGVVFNVRSLDSSEVAFLCDSSCPQGGVVLGADTRATEGPIVSVVMLL